MPTTSIKKIPTELPTYKLFLLLMSILATFQPHSRRPVLYRMKFILQNKTFYDIYFNSLQLTLDRWSQKALHCFQVLSFDARGLNKKEPGGQTQLQSSPTIPYSQLCIQSCLSVGENRKAAKFSNIPKSQSMPTVTP